MGHVLSKDVFHETPKSSMEKSFKAGYMIKLDKTFELYETKFHRVVWAYVSDLVCFKLTSLVKINQ